MSKLSEQVEQLEKELKQSNREYEELRELYIAERWELNEVKQDRDSAYLKRDIAEDKVKEVEQTRDILAYENRSLAEFIKHNDSTLTDSDVGDIACGAPDVWDSFINESANRMLEQNKTIRALRRKLTKIENICNDMNEEKDL